MGPRLNNTLKGSCSSTVGVTSDDSISASVGYSNGVLFGVESKGIEFQEQSNVAIATDIETSNSVDICVRSSRVDINVEIHNAIDLTSNANPVVDKNDSTEETIRSISSADASGTKYTFISTFDCTMSSDTERS